MPSVWIVAPEPAAEVAQDFTVEAAWDVGARAKAAPGKSGPWSVRCVIDEDTAAPQEQVYPVGEGEVGTAFGFTADPGSHTVRVRLYHSADGSGDPVAYDGITVTVVPSEEDNTGEVGGCGGAEVPAGVAKARARKVRPIQFLAGRVGRRFDTVTCTFKTLAVTFRTAKRQDPRHPDVEVTAVATKEYRTQERHTIALPLSGRARPWALPLTPGVNYKARYHTIQVEFTRQGFPGRAPPTHRSTRFAVLEA